MVIVISCLCMIMVSLTLILVIRLGMSHTDIHEMAEGVGKNDSVIGAHDMAMEFSFDALILSRLAWDLAMIPRQQEWHSLTRR